MPIGRPSKYTPELAEIIMARMSEGETLTDICREDGMPSRGTIGNWQDAHPDFLIAYARARERQASAIAEKAYNFGTGATIENAAAARVQMDAAKWFASRLDPRKWADRTVIAGDKDAPLVIEDTRGPVRDLLKAALPKVSGGAAS